MHGLIVSGIFADARASDRAFERTLSIQIYPSPTEDEIEYVVASLRKAFRNDRLT